MARGSATWCWVSRWAECKRAEKVLMRKERKGKLYEIGFILLWHMWGTASPVLLFGRDQVHSQSVFSNRVNGQGLTLDLSTESEIVEW